MNNKKIIFGLVVALLALWAIFLIPQFPNKKNIGQNNISALVREDFSLQPLILSPIRNIGIAADSALAVDLVTGDVLYEKNADAVLPLASLTKIVSSLVLLDMLLPDEIITISENAIATEGASSLRAGERYRVQDLLAMAMIESSNDAIAALVEHAANKEKIAPPYRESWFIEYMKGKAKNLGMSQKMVFYNSTGLDISDRIGGAYGSARDIIRIAQNSFSLTLWDLTHIEAIISQDGRKILLNPTNTLRGSLVQLRGAKTGFTDVAGGNLLILLEQPIGRPLGIVVLGSTHESRFQDIVFILALLHQNTIR